MNDYNGPYFPNAHTSTNKGRADALEEYRLSIAASNAERSELRAMRSAVERAIQTETIQKEYYDLAKIYRPTMSALYEQKYNAAVAARIKAEEQLQAKLNELKQKYREPGPRGSNAPMSAGAGAGAGAGIGSAAPGFFDPASRKQRTIKPRLTIEPNINHLIKQVEAANRNLASAQRKYNSNMSESSKLQLQNKQMAFDRAQTLLGYEMKSFTEPVAHSPADGSSESFNSAKGGMRRNRSKSRARKIQKSRKARKTQRRK